MSAMPVRAPRSRPTIQPSRRPRLRLVRAPSPARSRIPFLLLCLSILGSAMLGALALNTAMATTAYEIGARQQQLADLTQSGQQLTAQHDRMASPTQLAAAAAGLGMVPAEGLSYIDLANGTITGPAAALVAEGEG